MYRRKLTLVLLSLVMGFGSSAQQAIEYDEVNAKSYGLYEKGDWKALLKYGNEYLATSPDFALLRLRMGYAAFMLGNFSEAIKQYNAALQKDSYNEAAHYYMQLCRIYLNQAELAGKHQRYLSKEMLDKQKEKAFGITKLGTEVSYKTTSLAARGNGIYARLDLHLKLHPNVNMIHAGALYNQTISEPKLAAVLNNNNIAINQKEYYNKTMVNLGFRWQLVGAYHYAYTPFNNFIYNNHIGLLGVKYHHNYFAIQADAIAGNVTDTSLQQYNVTLWLYPLGNLNFYSISTASLRNRTNVSALNVKQVIGAKVTSFLWLEANATFGRFSNYFENDALYLYNAIDANKFKAGATAYISVTPKISAQLGYTMEQRELFQTKQSFNQHSITGGLSCKL